MVRLEVITGPMFSGKSEELIRRLRKAQYGQKRILVVKPKRDERTGDKIVARQKKAEGLMFEPHDELEAMPIESEKEFRDLIIEKRPEVIGIDEAQLFGDWIGSFLGLLMGKVAEPNHTGEAPRGELLIIVAGLDLDAWRKPFNPMPALMAMADEVRKEAAVCFECHGKFGPAVYTQKTGGTSERIEIGDTELYEARCRTCYRTPDTK